MKIEGFLRICSGIVFYLILSLSLSLKRADMLAEMKHLTNR